MVPGRYWVLEVYRMAPAQREASNSRVLVPWMSTFGIGVILSGAAFSAGGRIPCAVNDEVVKAPRDNLLVHAGEIREFEKSPLLAKPARSAVPAGLLDCPHSCQRNQKLIGCPERSLLPDSRSIDMAKWYEAKAIILICALALSGTAVLGQSGSSFDEVVREASVAREQNDVPRALQLYSRAVEVNPKWAEGWWSLGSLQYGAKLFSGARDSLSQYIALVPNSPSAFALRAQSEVELGDYEKALADIRQSLVLKGGDPSNEERLHIYECVLLTRLGRFEESLQAYRYFVEKGISTPELSVAIGLAGLRMALLPKEVSDDQREVLSGAGAATYQYMAGNEDGAADAFHSLFQHFPSQANLHLLYGFLLFPSNREASLTEFRREVDVSPSNQRAQVLTAWALLMQNRSLDALPYANKAVELNPESAAGQLVAGRTLVDLGQSREGMEHLERALQLEPENLEIHIALAEAYSGCGRKQDAERERALSLKLAQNRTNPFALP